MTDTLQSLPGKWRQPENPPLNKDQLRQAIRNGARMDCADELQAALAASGREAAHPPAADVVALLKWAIDGWHREVANRPLVNVHRRSLDDVWRQVIRKLGGDDIGLCGPTHDQLVAEDRTATTEGSE